MLKRNQYVTLLLLIFMQPIELVQGQNLQSDLSAEEREHYIQNALQLRKEGAIYQAIEQVDLILSSGSDDQDALMLKGDLLAQSQQYKVASTIYQQLLELDNQKIQAQINLSYTLFMNHKPVLALSQAKSAWEKDMTNKNAVVNYFNALLWNIKTHEAAELLTNQQPQLDYDQVLVMSARLFTSQGNYQKGLAYYDTLVTSFQNKHYVREYMEVLVGKQESEQAKKALFKAEDLFSKDEFLAQLKSIESFSKDQIGTSVAYFKDIAGNIGISNDFWWQHRNYSKTKMEIRSGWSNIRSKDNDKTTTKHLGFRLQKKLDISLRSHTELQVQKISFNNEPQNLVLTGQQSFVYQPHDRRQFGLFFKSEILNYTASLLSQNIRSNAFGYQAHLMFDGKNGFYSQGDFGRLSDDNQRVQFFGSFYHIFNRTPLFKAGVNVSALTYRDNQRTEYFAPYRFRSTELFAEFQSNRLGIAGLNLSLQAAIGTQQIEFSNWDPTFRFKTNLSYQLGKIETSLQYQASNVASNNGTGYQFDRFSLMFIYRL